MCGAGDLGIIVGPEAMRINKNQIDTESKINDLQIAFKTYKIRFRMNGSF